MSIEQNPSQSDVDAPKRKTPITRYAIILSLWIGFIFGTSCTVIRPLEFFEIVRSFTGADRQWMERFSLFWGVAWFGVVKGWHFAEFAILTFLTARVIQWWRGGLDTKSIAIAMLVCVLFAASDEWHQTFVPDRYGTFQDVLIDSLGVIAAGTYLLRRSHKATLQSAK
jgi:hypothetical protein